MKSVLSSLKERYNRSLLSPVLVIASEAKQSTTSVFSVSSSPPLVSSSPVSFVKLSSYKNSSSSGICNGSFVIRNGIGFTLVELMIVIAIIGVLAASLFPVMSNYLDRAKISGQIVNLGKLKGAIESYQADTGDYPISGGGWGNIYGCYGSTPAESTPNGWIPGLVAGGYIDKLPSTGMEDRSNSYSCGVNFLYQGRTGNYKLLVHAQGARWGGMVNSSRPELIDRARDGGTDGTLLDPPSLLAPWAYGYWTPGAVGW